MTSLQTIQIVLSSGDPQGIRIAEITTRLIRVIEVPRSLLADFLKMPEAKQVAVYCLVGSTEGGDSHRLYIGQSGNVGTGLHSTTITKKTTKKTTKKWTGAAP